MTVRDRRILGLAILLALCVGTRVLTTVGYVADPDSMRFGLSLIEYDIANLQPHFPGYPVFCFVGRLLYDLTGTLSLSFTLIGAISSFLLALFSLRFVNARFDRPEGLTLVVLLLFNPMIWLMSNRYMPDLLGTAVVVGIFALTIRKDRPAEGELATGIALVGLLAGIRLSYLPLVLLPAIVAFARSSQKPRLALLLCASIALWFVPVIADTGWSTLIDTALTQSAGHFSEFGGTVETVPDMEVRRVALVRAITADGLGGFWPGRAPLTLLVTLGLTVGFARGAWWMFHRETDGLLTTVLAISIYIVWILLFQNVVYQNRHVLPLLPFLLYPVWIGTVQLIRGTAAGRFAAILFLGAYAATGMTVALQQTRPTAIAQAAAHLRSKNTEARTIISSSLVNQYMRGTGVEGRFVAADKPSIRSHIDSVAATASRVVVVGWYDRLLPDAPDETHTFYHNPYVNTIWPEIPVTEYRWIDHR